MIARWCDPEVLSSLSSCLWRGYGLDCVQVLYEAPALKGRELAEALTEAKGG